MSGLGAIVEATDGSGPLLKLAEARAQALLGAESPSFSLLCLPPDKGSEDALFARLPRFDAVYTCAPALTPSTPAEFFSICPTMNSMKAHASWSVLSRTRAR